MRPGQLRQHARLLRERYLDACSRDAEAARMQADMMDAEAELAEARQDIPSPAPEEDCTIIDDYPIIGKVARRGGDIINIEHAWGEAHIAAARALGIDVAFEWCFDPRAGVDQSELIRIYIGTRTEGPRCLWHDGIWSAHKSKGNFGKNWACGGNWSSVGCDKGADLNIIAPDLAQKIREVIDMVTHQERIKQAEARVKAAQKRILACSQRDMAAAARRQADRPAYAGQEMICCNKANMAEAYAARTEAEADLILANAGL